MSNEPTSLPEAGHMLGTLLDDALMIDAPAPDAPEAPDADGMSEADEAQATAPADDDHEPPAAEQDGDDQDEGDDQDQDDDAEPAPATFKVKVDGEEIEVTQAELVNGYQRQADYSRKTQALAEDRKAVAAERGQYATMLGALHERITELQQAAATGHLTPEQHAVLQQQQAAAAAELDRLDAEHAHQQMVAGQQWLLQARPEWEDAETRQRDFAAITAIAQRVGYSPEEIAAANDPRMIMLAWKAAQFDKLQADTAEVRRTAQKRSARKVLKAGGANQRTDQSQKAKRDRLMKVQRGGLADAGAALSEFIDV